VEQILKFPGLRKLSHLPWIFCTNHKLQIVIFWVLSRWHLCSAEQEVQKGSIQSKESSETGQIYEYIQDQLQIRQ